MVMMMMMMKMMMLLHNVCSRPDGMTRTRSSGCKRSTGADDDGDDDDEDEDATAQCVQQTGWDDTDQIIRVQAEYGC